MENNDRSGLIFLAIGAAAGLALAASGLVERWTLTPDALPDHTIARVNGHDISARRLEELLSDLAADKRSALTPEDRRFALDRLIDEELLILRGLELGLPASSPQVRKALAAAVLAQLTAEAQAAPPDDAALRDIYEADADYFTRGARYRLRWYRLPDGQPAAEEIYRRLQSAGTHEAELRSLETARSDLLPDTLLPLAKIRDYVGSDLLPAVRGLAPGEFSRPVPGGGVWHIFHLIDQAPGSLPPLAEIRDQVASEYLRRQGDQALREYLGWLRERSEIIVNDRPAATP